MRLQQQFLSTYLVLTAAGLLILSFVFAQQTEHALLRSAQSTLSAIAAAKHSALTQLTQAHYDRALLIGSRTRMRIALADYNSNPNSKDSALIERILRDASAPVDSIEAITIYSLFGEKVAHIGDGTSPTTLSQNTRQVTLETRPKFDHKLIYIEPLSLEGQTIGTMQIVINAQEMFSIVLDHTGLQETGETLLIKAGQDNQIHFLTPLRMGRKTTESLLLEQDQQLPAHQALLKQQVNSQDKLYDYRHEPVLAATRYMPELDIGIVTKQDLAEATRPIRRLQISIFGAALALLVLLTLVSTYLSSHLTRPLARLTRLSAAKNLMCAQHTATPKKSKN